MWLLNGSTPCCGRSGPNLNPAPLIEILIRGQGVYNLGVEGGTHAQGQKIAVLYIGDDNYIRN